MPQDHVDKKKTAYRNLKQGAIGAYKGVVALKQASRTHKKFHVWKGANMT